LVRFSLFAAAGLAGLLFSSTDAVFAQPRSPSSRPLALLGGTIFVSPTAEPIQDGVVLIRDGKIAVVGPRASLSIPSDIKTLDCTGLTITAGFWNSHVHFMERKWAGAAKIPATELGAQLEAMLTRFGFTSVFDTGSIGENTRQLRDRIESGEVPGPRIRSTGEILAAPGGAPDPGILDALGFMRNASIEVADGAAALGAATELLDAGADGVKLYAATFFPPFATLPESAISAAVDEAHRRGKPAFAHPTNRAGLLAAVHGGVDVVVHTTPQAGPWDEAVLAAMKERGVALIPTLKLWTYELRHDREPQRQRFTRAGIDQLRAWVTSGGVVLFGTDVGYMGDYDPSDEYALMHEAGMTFRQILASLTTAPAARFGAAGKLGRIAEGFAADLVVLDGDPAQNARSFAAVRHTFRDGALIYTAAN
jgi:imidazolonepropionase-like amidohydrolase